MTTTTMEIGKEKIEMDNQEEKETRNPNQPAKRGRKPGSKNGGGKTSRGRIKPVSDETLSIATRLHQLRTEAKMSQSELASSAKVSVSYLSRLESGEVNPTVGPLARFANVFGLTLDQLVNGSAQETSKQTQRLDPRLVALFSDQPLSDKLFELIRFIVTNSGL